MRAKNKNKKGKEERAGREKRKEKRNTCTGCVQYLRTFIYVLATSQQIIFLLFSSQIINGGQ